MGMKALSKYSDIDKLFHTMAEIIYETEMAHGGGFWPFSPIRLHPIVADPFFKELYRLLKELEERSFTIEEIARSFINPNRVADYNFLWGFVRELPPEEGEYVASKLIEILKVLRNGNPFSEDNRNTVWLDKEVKERIISTPFTDLAKHLEFKQLVARIETLLTLYAELLYFVFPGFSRMYHGPYYFGGKTVFVKEFIDLRPTRLWSFTEDFPLSHFSEVGLYKDINIKVRFVGLIEADRPFPQALESTSLSVDGEPITNLESLRSLVDAVETKVNNYTQLMMSYSEKDLMIQGVKIFFYTLKPLYDALGQDIQVPFDISYTLERKSKEKREQPKPLDDLTKKEAIERIKQRIDIRFKKLKRIRMVAFDFIGVIAEPNKDFHLNKFIRTVAKNSVLKENEKEILFKAWYEHIQVYASDPLESIKRISKLFGKLKELNHQAIDRIGKATEELIATHFYLLVEGLKDLLGKLQQRSYTLVITTHVPHETVKGFLLANSSENFITKVYSAEGGKVGGELYQSLLDDAKELDIQPFDILVIDDQAKNLEKAKEHGLIGLLIGSYDILKSKHIDFLARNLEDIFEKLKGGGKK